MKWQVVKTNDISTVVVVTVAVVIVSVQNFRKTFFFIFPKNWFFCLDEKIYYNTFALSLSPLSEK